MIWINHHGGTPTFGISLGHHNETMNTEEWLGVTSRGILWACGKLDDKGQPLPGYEGSGVGPIDLTVPSRSQRPTPSSAAPKP
ncbi:MAG: hypothetical protein R3B90_14315 [Planctomycetaceae bacterium]